MDIAPDIDRFILFVLLVFPGMVAMRTYRLLMPARQVEWKDSIVEALFFSVLNFAIFFPLIPLIGEDGFPENHRYLFSTIVSMLIIPCPVIITVAYVKVVRSSLMHGFQVPHPTSWDYFFDRREPCFVLIHLKSGEYIGGLYSSGSFASSFPNHGDVYLETTYKV